MRRRKAGNPASPLDGVPIALKDIFLHRGRGDDLRLADPRRASSLRYDGTVVSLLKQAGLPILGKLNMDEFAMGSSTEGAPSAPRTTRGT